MTASGSAPDLELGLPEVPQNGFPALGEWIAEDPDSETFMFRKFQRLSARNLLFLQSQVSVLESKSNQLDKELTRADTQLRLSMMRYESWEEKAEDPLTPEAKRMRLAQSIKTTLKEYRESRIPRMSSSFGGFLIPCNLDEALILHSNIIHLPHPRKHQLETFRDWFSGRCSGISRNVPIIAGSSSKMLDDEDDLVCLRSPLEQDFLTQMLQRYWTQLVRLEIKHR